ncbi:hypothetical protein ACFOLC_04395 [Lysobacter cavernae]|uniref:Secreted protein n=1 Tax=Lysobacter cavernae TaxID=1685901 RepID=A0ABV7RM73_9GAMM
MRNKTALSLGLLAALVATAAFARPPGPAVAGEFYVYFDQSGEVVGRASIDCLGEFHQTGKATNFYSNGYAVCNPR